MTTVFTPPEGFNILDYRNFKDYPDFPPYVLRFQFSSNVVIVRITMVVMGWNLPECKTDNLFSRIVVSKNGMQDVYYDRPGGRAGLDRIDFALEKKLTTTSPNDEVMISFFPVCPVHMIDIDQIEFKSSHTTTPTTTTPPPQKKNNPSPSPTDNPATNNQEQQKQEENKNNPETETTFLQSSQPYWYIYSTIGVMIVLLMMSLLFRSLHIRPSCRKMV